MSDTETQLSELKEIFDCEVEIDTESASAADDSESKVVRFLTYTALRSLTSSGSSGLKGVLNDSELGEWFKKKTKKIKITYDDDSPRDCRVSWDDDTLIMTWGPRAKAVDEAYVFYTYSIFRGFYRVEKGATEFKEKTVPEAEKQISKTFGPGKGFDICVDWDSFASLEDPEGPTKRLYEWDGYYTTKPLCRAVYELAAHEEDPLVDAICDGLKSVTFVCEPGSDSDKKGYEVDKKGNVKLKMCFEINGWSGFFQADDVKSVLVAAGLRNKPEFKTYLLSSVSAAYRVHAWGYLNELEEVLKIGQEEGGEGLFYETNKDEMEAADQRNKEGRIIKLWGNLKKANRRGRKQNRHLLLTTRKFYTCEVKGSSIKDKNFRPHSLADIVCIDVYPASKMAIGTKPLGLTIWSNEVEEKKPGFFDRFKGKIKVPGVKLPNMKMPKVNVPKVDLPNVDLPDIDMPDVDMPDMPSLPSFDMSMPDLFDRKKLKQPKPKRYHPATKGVQRGFEFSPNDLDTKKGNSLMEEIAWSVYSAWAADTRRRNYEPFYLKEKKVFETGTNIEDCRPKTEDEKSE